MNSRERFLASMTGRPVDRAVYGAWTNAWPETVARWKGEGYDPAREPLVPADPWLWRGGWFYPNPPFERRVVEDDGRTVLFVNEEGILMRERKDQPRSSMPQFVRFPVETREEFRAFYRARMRPDLAARLGADYVAQLAAFRGRTCPLVVGADRWGGFFGGLRSLVGVERLCLLFYDDPAWVEEMMDAVADFIIAMMGKVLDHTDVDCFAFWEDMAYKTGPLVDPAMFRALALPRYRRVIEFLKGRGVPLVALDSDGDIHGLIPLWLDAGVDILYPFEVQCGMDVVACRKRYGRGLRMWFGIDKRALVHGPAAIDAELERVRPLVADGGYLPGLDHGVPPDVPFRHYLYYAERLRTILTS
jgi:uroporphyrinogen decarboxylase